MRGFVCKKCGNVIRMENQVHVCDGEEVEERNFTGDLIQDADFVLNSGGNRKYDVL